VSVRDHGASRGTQLLATATCSFSDLTLKLWRSVNETVTKNPKTRINVAADLVAQN
jgi:hypothetical protein